MKERLGVEDILKQVSEIKPEFVGINVFTQNYELVNAIQLSIISVVFCHREPLFFMPKNFKNITKDS